MKTGTWFCTAAGCCLILTCASAAAQPAGPDPVRAHDIASLEDGLPPLVTVPVVTVPSIDSAALAADARETRGSGPLRVASVVRTNISAFRSQGVVDESQVDDGDPRLTWRLRVAAPGATSIGVGFTRYQMPPGGRLFVFTPDYREILGPFTNADNADHGQLWIPRLPGEEIVVEISVPAEVLRDVQVEIGAVERGFLDATASAVDDCQTDVVCSAADRYSRAVRSVAYTEVTISNRTWICSGALINNTRSDRKPYFLTAYHCGGDTAVRDRSMVWNADRAASLRVFWRHHSDRCGQRLRSRVTRNWQSGARLVAQYDGTDFALLELTRPVMASSTYRQHFAGWNRNPTVYQVVAGIHHPAGQAKSIAFDQRGPYLLNVGPVWGYNRDRERYEWRVNYGSCNGAACDGLGIAWDMGGTTGGSSGSPLLNGLQQIIGQLWGGGGRTCGSESNTARATQSKYGWVKGSWEGGGTSSTRLRDWLDPRGISDVSISGIDAESGLPNLVVGQPRPSDSTLYAGQTFTLTVTVSNEGRGTAPATRLYWWHRPQGGSWARLRTSNTVSSLAPSARGGERVTVTAPSLVGTHSYAACVTSVAHESNSDDNCSSATDVIVRSSSGSPNLRVIRARVTDSTPTVGQRFQMYADVYNEGNATSASTTLRYWRRPVGGAWESTDSVSVGTISARRYRRISRTLTAPSRSGRYEYTACVDNVAGESNTDDNCARPFLTVTVGDGGGQGCATNWGTLSTGRRVNGSWTTGSCRSRLYTARYARYYSFTIGSRSTATIDLTSSSVDTFLALYSGGGFGSTRIESDDDDGDGRNARISRTLDPGTYTIEATTYSTERRGSFTLSVALERTLPATCTNQLGRLSSRAVRDGAWNGQCRSVHRGDEHFARYYSFTLARTTTMTMDLTSSTVDTWLTLYSGSGTGTRLTFDDDSGTGLNARIVRQLSAGTYTIEATTYLRRTTGSFRLTVNTRDCRMFDCLVGEALPMKPPPELIGGDPGTADGEALSMTPPLTGIVVDPAKREAMERKR